MTSVRKTHGVLAGRYNHEKQCTEFLLIQKPYCYGFNQFVMGRYSKNDRKNIQQLIKDMSAEDRAVLSGLNFDMCYHRIYKRLPTPDSTRYRQYIETKTYFTREFTNDSTNTIRMLLSQAPACPTQWSIPSGKKFHNEPDMNCAVREFTEETGIPCNGIQIMDTQPKLYQYTNTGVMYMIYCYLALLVDPRWHEPNNLHIDYRNPGHSAEVLDIKWLSLDEVKTVDTRGMINFLRPMGRIFRKRFHVARLPK